MQTICTLLQTDNHTNTTSLNFYRPNALPDVQPTVSKDCRTNRYQRKINNTLLKATAHTHTHANTRLTAPFSRTTQVGQYQKGKTNLDFTEARDSEWQWHQLGHMQVCTSLQADNHASIPPLSFYRLDPFPVAQPTASKHWRHQGNSNNIISTMLHSTILHDDGKRTSNMTATTATMWSLDIWWTNQHADSQSTPGKVAWLIKDIFLHSAKNKMTKNIHVIFNAEWQFSLI